MSDPTLHAWLRLLQAESPFPTSSFGAIEPPASADDLAERLATAFRNVATSVAMETSRADVAMPGDPEWFVALADHLLPLLSWSVGLGMGSAAADGPKRFNLVDRAKRLQQSLSHLAEGRVNEGVEGLRDPTEHGDSRHAMLQHVAMLHWRVQFETMLRPLVDGARGEVRVSFELPAAGIRIADLSPPPLPGSPTHGVVVRVLVPAVRVALHAARRGVTSEDSVELSRGAVVR